MGCSGCQGCEKRTPGCHDNCRTYKSFLIFQSVQKAKEKKYRDQMRFEKEARVRRKRAAEEAMHYGH